MTQLPSIIFFGNEQLATGLEHEQTPIFDALIAAHFRIAAVVLRPDKPRGRKKTVQPALIKQKAIDLNIPVLQPQKLSELVDELKMYSYDVGVLASYGRIVPQSVLDCFEPTGIVNIHPSRLPMYRGSSPIESAILNGDSQTAISLMKLSSGMDEGDIYLQVPVSLPPTISKQTAYDLLSRSGATALVNNLSAIASGKLSPQPQDISGVSYTTQLTKVMGVLAPITETAKVIERKIRAYAGYPKTRVTLGSFDVIVITAKVVTTIDPTALTLSCKDNTYLQITELIAPSGKKMNAEAFIRGYGNPLF